jgi:Nucleotidyl transferase AbiEii toxin, Type IV TA system
LRRQVAFDRLLARLFQVGDPKELPWVLKGGYAMELRIKAGRTTKDIDLTMRGGFGPAHTKGESEKHAILTRLQDIAARDLGDFFVYMVGEPISDLDAAP